MELSTRPAQIVAIAVTVASLVFFSWLTVWGQSPNPIKDKSIVTDQVVKKTDVLRVVSKDEIQRISDDTILRIQRLEDEVSKLKRQVKKLKAQIEGG